jgi:hypothetical protein
MQSDRLPGLQSGKWLAVPRWPDHCAIARMAFGIISTKQTRRMTMKNPLDTIWGTIISGLILTAILYFAVRNFLM